MNILIAEDEQDIRALLKLQLEQEGYHCHAVSDGRQALDALNTQSFSLALFDVMMPGLDGFNLLRKIRESGNMIPVIFLTARGDDMDKVLGLGLGADDYIVKPFSSAELLARVAAVLRRSKNYGSQSDKESHRITYGSLVLDTQGCCAYLNNTLIDLGAKEYKLLHLLMSHPGRVYTKKQLYAAVWDEDTYYDDNTIMVHISRLRNKLEADPKEPVYIKTIRGIGYKFSYEEIK